MPRLIDKPRLLEKLKSFHDYVRKNNGEIGTKQRGIDLILIACNLTCKYCFTNSPIGDHAKETLDLEMVASTWLVRVDVKNLSLTYKVVNSY